jgi:hypothetical protein
MVSRRCRRRLLRVATGPGKDSHPERFVTVRGISAFTTAAWLGSAVVTPLPLATDWVGIATALGLVLTALAGLVTAFRIERVHKVVNSASVVQIARVDQLAQALQSAGVAIPETPAPGTVVPTGSVLTTPPGAPAVILPETDDV